MTTDEDIVWELTQLPDENDRQRFLERVCDGDDDRLNRLRELVKHQADADRLFENLDDASAKSSPKTRRPLAETKTQFQSLVDTPNAPPRDGAIRRVANYQLIRNVGQGGMGNVFQARDVQLDRVVALKIPRVDLMFASGLERRFLREARAAARLDHPNLVAILGVGSDGPFPYIAAQWCDGGDLATWMRRDDSRREPREVAGFMAQVADAIEHCHDGGIIHLDIKPSNILLVSRCSDSSSRRTLGDWMPKVTDFGLARLTDSQLDKTSTSLFLGTPLYMAPEQAECKRELIGPTSDVFALGVVLHELATGARPFDGDTTTAVLDQVRNAGTGGLPATKSLPRDLRIIISRCLQRDPVDRYASAGELSADLRRFAEGQAIQAQAVSPARRAWLWCSRPERITQAGAVTLAIQIAVLGNLYSHFLLLAIGYEIPFKFDNWEFFLEGLPVALFPHVPLLINSVRLMRHRRGSMAISVTLSVVFLLALLFVLLGGTPAFSAYIENPLATYVAHLFIFCLAAIQLGVHLIALPAAIKEYRQMCTC